MGQQPSSEAASEKRHQADISPGGIEAEFSPCAKRRRLSVVGGLDVSQYDASLSCDRKNEVLHHRLIHTPSDALPDLVQRSLTDHGITYHPSNDRFELLRRHHCTAFCRVSFVDINASGKSTSTFAWGLSLARKCQVLRFLLSGPVPLSRPHLRRLAIDHRMSCDDLDGLSNALSTHHCTKECFVRIEDLKQMTQAAPLPPPVSLRPASSPGARTHDELRSVDNAPMPDSRYRSGLTPQRKNEILSHRLTHISSDSLPAFVRQSLIDHHVRYTTILDIFGLLRSHRCTASCCVLEIDAEASERATATFAWGLPIARKAAILNFVIKGAHTLSFFQLNRLAVEHHVGIGGLDSILAAMASHRCSEHCLIRVDDVNLFAQALVSPPSIPYQHTSSSSSPAPPYPLHQTSEFECEDESVDEDSWPEILSWDEHKAMLRESRARTSRASLVREACSFCNKRELMTTMRTWPAGSLDVSLLDSAVRRLRDFYDVPEIQPYRLFDGRYRACSSCSHCIKKSEFVRVPLLGWANGCWIGDVPSELADLTFAEELVIARAHTTKCWVKLNAGQRSPVIQQRAASGNICVHPHEITNLATHLPRPINTLFDEIVVMFVTDDHEASEDTFKSTPLLVRRGKVLAALRWLKIHNRLYHDIEINDPALPDYPDETQGHTLPPYPIQFVTPNSTQSGLSSTYSGHGIDGTEAMFSVDGCAATGGIPITTSGSFDVDGVQSGLNLRKIQALKSLKEDDSPLLKTSTSSSTLNTRSNPDLYGMLWPTLFPYGVGLFEDPMRTSVGFRPIHLRTHVKHYLQLFDQRFQRHLTFIFAMQSIQMMRKMSYQSRLAVRRAWWPRATAAMEKVDVKVLDEMIKKMLERQARMDYSVYKAADSSEQVILDLLKFIDYCSEDIEGSTAHVMKMREEIRALSRACGTPSIFFTLNPADNHNPLSSFVAGKDIDLDALFDNPDSRYSAFDRARSLAANPVAGAEFFELMVHEFIDIFLGVGRKNRRGVFGKVRHYYGVVEAQNRGSLHLHILIWLEGALSPIRIQHKASADPQFKRRLFSWLDNIFSHDFPPDTVPGNFKGWARIACLCGRPPHPDAPDFDIVWPQYVRHVLEASGQEHDHGDSCFKKLTRSFASLTSEERDKLCRFFYPLDLVPETYMDNEGRIFFQRHNANMVGHNTTISGAFQCNTDGKFVGSGPFALALGVYMTNYTTKTTLDSAVVMTALAAATASLQRAEQGMVSASVDERDEHCRRLLLKTLNQMNSRRELSGQQVSSALLGIPNHFTDCYFQVVYWSSLLSWLSSTLFPPFKPQNDESNVIDDDADNVDAAEHTTDHDVDTQDDLVDLANARVTLPGHPAREPLPSSIVYDAMYRPLELEHVCLWDQLRLYDKVALRPVTHLFLGETEEESELVDEGHQSATLHFVPGHPQYNTHVLKKRGHAVIPVLTGFSIPRRDLPDQRNKYCVAMLALFHPWSRNLDSPIKGTEQSWDEAWVECLRDLPSSNSAIVDHIQEQWECRKAAADFAAMNRTRYASFRASVRGRADPELDADLVDDLDWQLGQEEVGGAPTVDDLEGENESGGLGERDTASPTVMLFSRKAEASHLYSVHSVAYAAIGRPTMVSFEERMQARLLADLLHNEREAKKKVKALLSSSINQRLPLLSRPPDRPPVDPVITTLTEELRKAKLRADRLHAHNPMYWETLHQCEREAIAVANTMTLNRKQRIAFLLIVDNHLSALRGTKQSPFRIILGGSGGTGKSHLYDALRLWHGRVADNATLMFTAPTGIAAANIGGSTVHSELSLRLRYEVLSTPNSACVEKLQERLSPIQMLIIDEFYFIGCTDFSKICRNLNIARACRDDAFGGLDVILSGDHFQLPGPFAAPLYRHSFTTSFNAPHSCVHGLNKGNRGAVEAVKNLWSIRQCVIMDEIVRQRDPRFVCLLERLRYGNCTLEGPDSDLQYLRQLRLKPSDPGTVTHTDILQWVRNPDFAPPLITYTNAIREEHNWRMTQCFAATTGQEFAVYYSHDTTGKGRHRVQLTGQNANDAWNMPPKYSAHDLAGRLPLTIGMPILIVENLAVELGLCNGSFGTLVSIQYVVDGGRRYASSVELDVPRFLNPNKDVAHPHRIAIPLSHNPLKYRSSANGKTYSGVREQVPIVPGFAFTAHNSQSRSLNAVTVHLESSVSAAASYVMLSRIKCDETGPLGLRIMGEVLPSKIATHAAEEVRREEGRLQALQRETLTNAATRLQWYYDATGDGLF